MPLPDPKALSREEFLHIQDRLDVINAHAENEGATFTAANTVEILDHANRLYAYVVHYLAVVAEGKS
jgi:hypothetical protein